MALTIRDIIARNLFPGLTVAAGQSGLDHVVSWVNIMEILDTPQTVQPGELLVTTGYGLADRDKYGTLMDRLREQKISGVAVQTGYYIDRIPDFILSSADRCGIPVLNLPSDYSFSDILHVIIGELGTDPELLNPSGFDSGFFRRTVSEALAGKEDVYFAPGTQCRLICVCASNANAVSAASAQEGVRRLCLSLNPKPSDCISVLRPGGQGCFLAVFPKDADFCAAAYGLLIQITEISEESALNLYAGTDLVASPAALPDAFRHTAQCLALLKKIEARRGIAPYEDCEALESLGLLLGSARNLAVPNRAIRLLAERDRGSRTALLKTLRIYLAENCNASRAAERLFIHRHTLINRLQTIRELTGIHLEDYFCRLSLSNAHLLRDYFDA